MISERKEFEAEILSLRHRNSELARTAAQKDREFEKAKQELTRYERAVVNAEAGFRRVQALNDDLKNDLGQARYAAEQLKEALDREQARSAELTEQLEARKEELRGLRPFLSTEDVVSGADVLAQVKAINDEILQASATLSEYVQLQACQSDLQKTILTAHSSVNGVISTELVSLLFRGSAADEPIILQMVMQCALARMAKFTVTSWSWRAYNDDRIFLQLHEGIKARGDLRQPSESSKC